MKDFVKETKSFNLKNNNLISGIVIFSNDYRSLCKLLTKLPIKMKYKELILDNVANIVALTDTLYKDMKEDLE